MRPRVVFHVGGKMSQGSRIEAEFPIGIVDFICLLYFFTPLTILGALFIAWTSPAAEGERVWLSIIGGVTLTVFYLAGLLGLNAYLNSCLYGLFRQGKTINRSYRSGARSHFLGLSRVFHRKLLSLRGHSLDDVIAAVCPVDDEGK